MSQTHEVTFEQEICAHLEAHGWLYSENDKGYDKQRALFPEDVFGWLAETQPEEFEKLVKPTSSPEAQAKAKDGILTRLAKVLDQGQPSGGSLHVLRDGFKDQTASFRMMQKRPEQSINPKLNALYAANRLRVMRQVHYSTKNSNAIDLVFFINGIPVATAELKTDFTQHVGLAKKQYQHDRNPAGEPLLGFGTRALVHFAVSNDEVWMTTKLAGPSTFFLPFNRGDNGHKGNGPDEDGGSPTTYLWRDVLQRDQWLDVVGKFIHYEKVTRTDDSGRTHTSYTLIFPRFHQLDAVTKIVADARANGPGERYLIQHSAGSGKTRSIAWSAHRLATLHDAQDRKVFDTVIVVTDRNVLDAQLQDAVKQIESKSGVVQNVSTAEAGKQGFGSKSSFLREALTGGKLITVVTLQTFPVVFDLMKNDSSLKGRSFAVIADEAHSSQTGEAAAKLKKVLTDQEIAELEDGGEIDVEAVLAAKAGAKADSGNITFLAFTATPKAKTMEMFGTRDEDGLPHPFHTYTMAQAIEENFIVDVLESYTTYDTAFELATRVSGGEGRVGPRVDGAGELVDETVATKGLMRWVKLHPTNIAQKVQIIVEHFRANVAGLLDGRAKAMVVTDSRKSAVRYKLAMDKYIAQHGYTGLGTMVAFSGAVTDLESGPADFTEASMNPGVKDLRTAFARPEYQVMIVANKFQTGFDQPMLCAMYVDKKLAGVAAVQTLSRLNRFVPGKKTMVVDFVNTAEEILEAFIPYYAEARIETTTDPNLIHDIQAKLDVSGWYTPEEVDAVVEAYVRDLGNNAVTGALQPVKHRWASAYSAAVASGSTADVDELVLFRKDVGSFVRLYDFLSQIINFGDTDVEKHALFYRLLLPLLKAGGNPETVDLSDVELVHIKQREQGTHSLDLAAEDPGVLRPMTAVGSRALQDPKMVRLAELVDRLNEMFAGEDFTVDYVWTFTKSIAEIVSKDSDVREQAQVNSEAQFLASPTLHDSVVLAVAETKTAHGRMTELFNERGGIEQALIEGLGRYIYELLQEIGESSQIQSTAT